MEDKRDKKVKCELYHDNFENARSYQIPKAQLMIADIPYNIGANAHASRSDWYIGGDRHNGESKNAKASFFFTDESFNLLNFFRFCTRLMKPEPKKAGPVGRSSDAPCMIVFCSFQQQQMLIDLAKEHGLMHYIPLSFVKSSSSQVLKCHMKIVGATEHALVFYRDKLPKFRNTGGSQMTLDWMLWERDGKEIPKIHPTQKPYNIIRKLIETFTDEGDVVIDPCAGSAITLRAARDLGRNSYGFEIYKPFYEKAVNEMLNENYIDTKKQIEGQISIFDEVKR